MVTQSVTIKPEDGDDDEKQDDYHPGPCHEGPLHAALAADEDSSARHT